MLPWQQRTWGICRACGGASGAGFEWRTPEWSRNRKRSTTIFWRLTNDQIDELTCYARCKPCLREFRAPGMRRSDGIAGSRCHRKGVNEFPSHLYQLFQSFPPLADYRTDGSGLRADVPILRFACAECLELADCVEKPVFSNRQGSEKIDLL